MFSYTFSVISHSCGHKEFDISAFNEGDVSCYAGKIASMQVVKKEEEKKTL